ASPTRSRPWRRLHRASRLSCGARRPAGSPSRSPTEAAVVRWFGGWARDEISRGDCGISKETGRTAWPGVTCAWPRPCNGDRSNDIRTGSHFRAPRPGFARPAFEGERAMSSKWSKRRVTWGVVLCLASTWVGGVSAASACPRAAGADDDNAPPPPVRTVVIGPQYQKGAVHRWLWGADYRDLYATPVELPVLDLSTYAGGLTPTTALGHGETQALGLKGRDGKDYTFRPVIKDPTTHLPVDLRDTLARRVLIDQMASGHPAGHVVAPALLRAPGVLHNEPHLVVMADDPGLGEYRKEFANVVGDIEEWGGSPAFGGTVETIDGEEMWKRLRESPDVRADSRAYLKARLVDQLMGDWDR